MATKNKKTTNKKKTNAWFYTIRGSYLPKNAYGWMSYVPFTAYLAFSCIVGVKDISRVWLAALFIIPNWIAAGAVMTVLAKCTS